MEGTRNSFSMPWALLAGMGAFWPALHASPYYPLSVTAEFSVGGAAAIASHHALYALVLILFFAAWLILGKRRESLHANEPQLALASGVLGFAGLVVLAANPSVGGMIEGVALVLVAASTSFFLVAWLTALSLLPKGEIASTALFSYAVFSAVWLVVQLAAPGFASAFIAVCPLVSCICLLVCGRKFPNAPQAQAIGMRQLPWGLIVACLAFVYFGVIAVRVFTTMEQGAAQAGLLGLGPSAVSTAAGLVISLAGAIYLKVQPGSQSAHFVGLAVLTLIYIASLLLMMTAQPGSQELQFSKRVLVGAEHCFELMVAILVCHQVAKRTVSPSLVFPLFGICVAVLPQFVSFDLLFNTGVLASLNGVDLITPIAAVATFAIVAGVVGFFVSSSSKAAAMAAKQGADWQKDLCQRATEGFGITGRELDVVELTYRGYSAKKIAEELFVSESTVKAHLSHAYRKMDIHSKQELIALVDSYR